LSLGGAGRLPSARLAKRTNATPRRSGFVTEPGYQIPVRSAADVAIYTEHFEGLSLLRKILLRMKSWKNYVFLESL